MPYPSGQENGPTSIQACRERVPGIEANGGLNTFHFNGLQQSQLHMCNHSVFNLILVSNTFSEPNTSKKCHHLIGRYSMHGLETRDWMCRVFTWIWNESVNLHFRKGTLFGKHSQARFFTKRNESCTWKAWWSASPGRDIIGPRMTQRQIGSIQIILYIQSLEVRIELLNQVVIKPLTDFWWQYLVVGNQSSVHTEDARRDD